MHCGLSLSFLHISSILIETAGVTGRVELLPQANTSSGVASRKEHLPQATGVAGRKELLL